MVMVYQGIVKNDAVIVRPPVHLPEGQVVEIRVGQDEDAMEDAFARVMARRAANAGRRIGIDAIIEEDKQERR